MALAEAVPGAGGDGQAQVGRLGPGAEGDEDRAALAGPGGEAAGLGPGSRGGGRTSTTSTASRRAATTVVQALGPGAGTRARRSRAMPVSAAATIPRSGRPTAATQEPAAEAPATRARARAAERLTVTVVPRRSPWPGSSGRRAGTTGSSRSSARVVPGPTSSARAEAPELLRVVLRPLSVAAMALYVRGGGTCVRECQATRGTAPAGHRPISTNRPWCEQRRRNPSRRSGDMADDPKTPGGVRRNERSGPPLPAMHQPYHDASSRARNPGRAHGR